MNEVLIEKIERLAGSRETISFDSDGAQKAFRLLKERDKLLEEVLTVLRFIDTSASSSSPMTPDNPQRLRALIEESC